MEFDITRLSSKGQVVIPSQLRKGFNEGEKLLIIRNNKQIVIQKADTMDKKLAEDLEFARRTERAWKQIDEGKCKSYSVDEFLKRLHNGNLKNL